MDELSRLKKDLNEIKAELNFMEGVTWDNIEELLKGLKKLTGVVDVVVTYLESQTSLKH